MQATNDVTPPMGSLQQKNSTLAPLESSLASQCETAATLSIDINTVPISLRVTSGHHSSCLECRENAFNHLRDPGIDDAPGSPGTLLGEDIDLDEMCSPSSIAGSQKSFVAETPPWSPSTMLGDQGGLQMLSGPSSTGLGIYDEESQHESPSTIIGDELNQDGVNTSSSKPGSSPPASNTGSTFNAVEIDTSEQSFPEEDSSPASRHYMQLSSFMCDAIPLIDKWPCFVLKAFMDEDWKFGLSDEGKPVLEMIPARNDLEKWFAAMGNH